MRPLKIPQAGSMNRILFHIFLGCCLLVGLTTCSLPSRQNPTPQSPTSTNAPILATGTNVPTSPTTTATATTAQARIVSISVCSPDGRGGEGSCPKGTFDTQQIVLAPDGKGINTYGGLKALTDEHTSIFSPGMLGNNKDYLFFVASGSSLNAAMGVVVLSGGSGPDQNGQWKLDFATADGYGSYVDGFGQVFLTPTQHICPTVADGDPAHQDQTFDLGYSAAGSIVKDPTNAAGNLLMVYEGANICVGNAGGPRVGNGGYISVAIATSLDYGHTWPTYRETPGFSFVPLPLASHTQGPNAPSGALGASVCMGNDCSKSPPTSYGRYPVISLPVSLAAIMAEGKSLSGKPGVAEPSGFVDDVTGSSAPSLYVVHGYNTSNGLGGPPISNSREDDLAISRAQLNGGTAPLSFTNWDGEAFAQPGMGGLEAALLPDGPYRNCGDLSQARTSGSISYVQETRQYLLTFVCNSPTDPESGAGSGRAAGSAWFYSTADDLADQTGWSLPKEIAGSWSQWDNTGVCPDYKGWYPTFMSPGRRPGHLSLGGYVFYQWGCLGGAGDEIPPARQYAARAFSITIH